MQRINVIFIIALLFVSTSSYGVTITRSTATTASITDFYQDFSYCSCNVSPSLCDNYCCCDTSCSAVLIYLFRLRYQVGSLLKVVWLHHPILKVSAMTHRYWDSVLFRIFLVFIFQIEELLGTSTLILKLPRSLIPLRQNCTQYLNLVLQKHQELSLLSLLLPPLPLLELTIPYFLIKFRPVILTLKLQQVHSFSVQFQDLGDIVFQEFSMWQQLHQLRVA